MSSAAADASPLSPVPSTQAEAQPAQPPVSPKPKMSRRQAAIRACFHNDEGSIEVALGKLYRFNNKEMEMKGEGKVPEVAFLVDGCDASDLVSRSAKRNLLPRDDGEDDAKSELEEKGCTASSTEISASTKHLNFCRWLCGLPPVRLSAARLAVCNIVSMGLVPRSVPLAQLNGDSAEFQEALAHMITREANRVSILQGNASLITAVETCLGSTHTLSSNVVKTMVDPTEHAAEIAEKIAQTNPAALTPDYHTTLEDRRIKKACARAPNYDHEPQPIVHARDLPVALRPFKVFWDLQTNLPKNVADPKSFKGMVGKMLAVKRLTKIQFQALKPVKEERQKQPVCSKLSGIWGDRQGVLAFRRCLLNPALVDFGAARRYDTCVLWTGHDHAFEEHVSAPEPELAQRKSKRKHSNSSVQKAVEAAQKAAQSKASGPGPASPRPGDISSTPPVPLTGLGAVCWPPCGIVPLFMVDDRCIAWTIMPDASRFQPTDSTQIRAWRVKMERPTHGAVWTAERQADIPIKDFTIDCSNLGEPFCVSFWPDFGPAVNGAQFEVQLSGLRGERTKLSFFYQFHDFQQTLFTEHLVAEATSFRALIGDTAFWGVPKDPILLAFAEHRERQPTLAHIPGTHQSVSYNRKKSTAGALRTGSSLKWSPLRIVSHHEVIFTTNCVDVTIVLQSEDITAIRAKLMLVRFSGEEEEVPCATLVQRLPDNHFVLRAKLPMSRQRFELRLFTSTSTSGNPKEFTKHGLRFMITTGNQCQSLLSTLDDPRKKKFGYAQIDASSQSHGIVVVAPVTRRLPTGKVYFLIYVDKSQALAAAEADADRVQKQVNEAQGSGQTFPTMPSQRNMRLYNDRLQLQMQDMPEDMLCKTAVAARSMVHTSADKMEESVIQALEQQPETLGRKHKYNSRSSQKAPSSATQRHGSVQTGTVSVTCLQHNLCALLQNHTQDTSAEVQLDVQLRGGEIVFQLRERADFPGFFEGFFTFGDEDIDDSVALYYRFPVAHAFEYAPRKLGEWVVVRDELLPQNF